MFSRRRSANETPSSALAELSCNSPTGPMRVNKSRAAKEASPYGKKKGRSLLSQNERTTLDVWDSAPLLTPGRLTSAQWMEDKRVILKKPTDGGKVGMRFNEYKGGQGVILTRIEEGSASASSTLLVGDVITQIDGIEITSPLIAQDTIGCAKPGASLFITALGGTREVSLDKREGDCGMTCSAASYVKRGVLLKRIAKGSLADVAKLYPGDTIVSVNGTLVNHHTEAVAAIDQVADMVKIVVLGESQEVEILPKTATNKAALGITLTSHEAPTDGVGVRVQSVVADGRAAAAGLTAGDTLLAVDGVLCTDHQQAIKMLDMPAHTEPLKVVVMSKYAALQ